MTMKRKAGIAGIGVCLTLLLVSLSIGPQVEVQGDLSKRDVAELTRLGRVERGRDLIDWSPTRQPQRWDIREVPYKWKRFRFNSAPVVRIDQMLDNKAEVTIGTGTSMRRYQFVSTEQGWKRAPLNIE